MVALTYLVLRKFSHSTLASSQSLAIMIALDGVDLVFGSLQVKCKPDTSIASCHIRNRSQCWGACFQVLYRTTPVYLHYWFHCWKWSTLRMSLSCLNPSKSSFLSNHRVTSSFHIVRSPQQYLRSMRRSHLCAYLLPEFPRPLHQSHSSCHWDASLILQSASDLESKCFLGTTLHSPASISKFIRRTPNSQQ